MRRRLRSLMNVSAVQLRRAVTQLVVRQAIAATAKLSIDRQRRTLGSLVALASRIPMLQRRVRENMILALGPDVPVQAESLYFRRLGWFLANTLPTFHHGIAATPALNEVRLDESIDLLDEAVAEGRGVVVTSPHWSGHELVSAVICRGQPATFLVRQAPTAERMAAKLKWYNALGVEIVLRPSRASSIKDAVAYLNVLKKGKVLAITPDLIADPGQGVKTQIFGRTAGLHGGAFAIAIMARAPMLRLYLRWQSDSSVLAVFERVPELFDGADRDGAIRSGVQDWCCW